MLPNSFFEIGGEPLGSMYGVCIAIGVILCILVLRKYGRLTNVSEKFMDVVEITGYVAILVGFFSSALFQGIYNYIEDPSAGFSLTGGITFIGGLIGGVVSFLIIYYIWRYKNKDAKSGRLIDALPFIPCSITLAHGFGRIGCFFAGCCFGKPTDSWLGMTFSPDSPVYFHGTGNVYPQKVFPTNLFEAIFLLILFGLMTYLVLKKHFKYNFVVYLGAYGVFRFLIEYIRGDDRGALVGSISPSQTFSLVMILLMIPVYFILRNAFKVRNKEINALEENINTVESHN